MNGLPMAIEAFWAAGIEEVYIDGSFCTSKPDPGDIDGYWVEPDAEIYERIDPYWIDFTLVSVPQSGKLKWRVWVEHGLEFFIHPAMGAAPDVGFPEFFRSDRDGRPRGVIRLMKANKK